MRNIFIRCIRFSLQKLLQNNCERDVCQFSINDERDPKESNEGCQDAAEAPRVSKPAPCQNPER